MQCNLIVISLELDCYTLMQDLGQINGGLGMCESYVIRIYSKKDQKDAQGTNAVMGVVESTDNNRRIAFHGKEELWNSLLICMGQKQDVGEHS